jgi:hypothetical protein
MHISRFIRASILVSDGATFFIGKNELGVHGAEEIARVLLSQPKIVQLNIGMHKLPEHSNSYPS